MSDTLIRRTTRVLDAELELSRESPELCARAAGMGSSLHNYKCNDVSAYSLDEEL